MIRVSLIIAMIIVLTTTFLFPTLAKSNANHFGAGGVFELGDCFKRVNASKIFPLPFIARNHYEEFRTNNYSKILSGYI